MNDNNEEKIENEKIDLKRANLGWPGIFIFFLGILLINSIWFALFPDSGQKYFALVGAATTSLLLGFFLFYRIKKYLEKNQNIQQEVVDFYRKKISETKKSSEREEQREKTNEKLRKTNQEFMETTRKLFERETELKKANQRLQEVDNVKSEFVSVAAHQLRTPLTGIKWSYTTLLEKDTGPLNKVQKEIVEKGLETIDYAISVINDLLNTARLEEGKTGFNFTVQPIGPIIQEIVSQHKAVIEEKKIEFIVDV